jgi:hypothetical protein
LRREREGDKKVSASPKEKTDKAFSNNESELTASRRGWATTIFAVVGFSSSMNWGICVVFPQPVSPVTRTTLDDLHDSSSLDKKSSRAFHAGSAFRCRSMDLLQQKGVAGGVCFGGVDQKTLLALGRLFIDIP